jgi:bifunctional DNase/RNase
MSDTGAGQVEVPETAPTAPDGSAPDGSAPVDPTPDGSVPVDPTPADAVAGAQGPDTDPDIEPGTESDTEPDIEPDIEPEAVPAAPMGDFSMALVSAITVDLPNQHPSVLLRETESPRRQLSFSIGLPDAVALSHALRRIPTPRPLTNELLSDVLRGFDIDVVAVRLVGRQGSVYFAELDLRGRDTRSVLSSRPSDALCVALLQPVPVPILIDRRLLEQAGDVQPAGKAAPTA